MYSGLTNAFSRKPANHVHMLSLYFMYYNLVRFHRSLRIMPAIATEFSMDWNVGLIDARSTKANRLKAYHKQNSN